MTTATASLDLTPASVGRARTLVRRAVSGSPHEALTEDAELLVSEVVTNALVHAATPVEVRIDVAGDRVRVEVSDGNTNVPSVREYSTMAGTGRGLRLLEQLVDRWGVEPTSDGKTVWFELGSRRDGSRADSPMELLDAPRRPSRQTVTVVLLDVPLALHAAWQMHADSTLREHLLATLDVDQAAEQMEAHAAANDAKTLLCEAIPQPEGGAPETAERTDWSRSVAPRVEITVPVASVRSFAVLDEMLTAALKLIDPQTSWVGASRPELERLRRWLCTEIRGQAEGRPPRPWRPQPA